MAAQLKNALARRAPCKLSPFLTGMKNLPKNSSRGPDSSMSFYFCVFLFLSFKEVISNLQQSDKNSTKSSHILLTSISTFCHVSFVTLYIYIHSTFLLNYLRLFYFKIHEQLSPKNKDVLLYNNSAVIRVGKFNLDVIHTIIYYTVRIQMLLLVFLTFLATL